MQPSGVESAIRELEREAKKIHEAISMLKRMASTRFSGANSAARPRRRLSASARRRISEAATKRWAAVRAKAKSAKS